MNTEKHKVIREALRHHGRLNYWCGVSHGFLLAMIIVILFGLVP